jgi:hypothetical protein
MSKDELQAAVSQRKAPPPLTRGKGVQLSVDQEQNGKTATQQKSETAGKQDSNSAPLLESEMAKQQDSDTAIKLNSVSAEQQKSETADMLDSDIATQQSSVSAIKRSSEVSTQQNSVNAEVQSSETAKQQKSEVKRINRGVTLPEDLFREYKVSAAILDVSMHKLMEEILQDGLNKVRKKVAKRSRYEPT